MSTQQREARKIRGRSRGVLWSKTGVERTFSGNTPADDDTATKAEPLSLPGTNQFN